MKDIKTQEVILMVLSSSVSTEQVIEAFRKARYYDEYVSKYGEEIKKANAIISFN